MKCIGGTKVAPRPRSSQQVMMDSPKPFDAAAEDWLWSLPWVPEPKYGWSFVIECLRNAARAEQEHDCAEWADLIEALTTTACQPSDASSAMEVEFY
jgi:hypothetical protein